jgi:hypothetical protein
MRKPRDLVSRMQDFCGFLAGLGDVQAEVLLAPCRPSGELTQARQGK